MYRNMKHINYFAEYFMLNILDYKEYIERYLKLYTGAVADILDEMG